MVKKRKLRAGELGTYFVIFILPALIIYLLFSITPFLYTIYYSFTDYTDMNPINLHFVGLKNYIKVLQTPVMLAAIKNSVIYAILLTGFQTLLGLPLAFVLNQKLKSRNLLRAVFFFPAVFSSLIIGYLWNFIMSSSDFGLINNILHQLGLGTLNFFTSKNALYSVILTQIWQWTGWAMVIFLANLQSISPDLYEAAEIDGANGLKKFMYVTLPLMCPSVKIVIVTGLIGGMKVFDKLMELPILRIFNPFYKKYKEMLLYLFFGGLSFIVSIATYACFNVGMGINELIANIFSWIITVMFAFLTNRVWVFQSPTDSVQAFIKQMFVFYSGRVITLVVEEAILLVFITWLGFNSMLIKVIAQVIVIVLNYVISKLVVFKERS